MTGNCDRNAYIFKHHIKLIVNLNFDAKVFIRQHEMMAQQCCRFQMEAVAFQREKNELISNEAFFDYGSTYNGMM